MKTFTAAALVASTYAGHQMRGCQYPEVVQDFQTEAYLGRWYEQARDIEFRFEHGICATANYKLNDDGTIRVRNNEYDDTKEKWGGGTGKAHFVDESKDEGYLKVKFVSLQPAGDYKVIGTDYDNYSVVYSCTNLAGLYSFENVWILSRAEHIDATHLEEVKAIMREQIPKYDFETMSNPTTQGSVCPYDSEPEGPYTSYALY